MRILYLGFGGGTSLHRFRALRRLGHEVELLDPFSFLPKGKLTQLWIWKAGGLFLGNYIARRALSQNLGKFLDLVWVDNGELVDRSLIRALRQRFSCPIVNYNVDNPYVPRDGARWRIFHSALPEYDLVVLVRASNIEEARARGAREVMRVFLSADEVAHAPRQITAAEHETWGSDVLFVGTWMPERSPFMARLVELGVPLTIYGDRWDRSPEWPMLQKHWRGPGLYREEDYAIAIQSAKVCLGLLSKGNCDLITQRTFEIPYLGRPLCAERTSEHSSLYREGEEAEFWSTPEECAQKCKLLLEDPERREALAANGRRRLLRNGTTNEAVLASVLDRVFADRLVTRPDANAGAALRL